LFEIKFKTECSLSSGKNIGNLTEIPLFTTEFGSFEMVDKNFYQQIID